MSSSDVNDKSSEEYGEFIVDKIVGHKTAADLRESGEAPVDGSDDKLYFKASKYALYFVLSFEQMRDLMK